MDMPQSKRNETDIFAGDEGSGSGESTRGSIRFDSRWQVRFTELSWLQSAATQRQVGYPASVMRLSAIFLAITAEPFGSTTASVTSAVSPFPFRSPTKGAVLVSDFIGTAIGECGGEPCIKVLVSRKNPELLKKIPSELEGYQISIEETGELRRLDSR